MATKRTVIKARRNKKGRIVKIFICFLGVLISLVFTQFAVAGKSIHLKSWCTIFVPDFIPDFSMWRSRFTPITADPSLFLFYVEAINPDNPSDFVILYVAHEIKDDSSEENIIIAIENRLRPEKGENRPPRVVVDQKYLRTGVPSFQFTEVPELPELDSLIRIKTAEKKHL
ncbi:MAG: hypothetical protein OEW45_02555 [Deltaproteobacteria bacterium]|nr:hypothetical protein [Deltaproteobacteria bacterium]